VSFLGETLPASRGIDWGCGPLEGSSGSPQTGFLRIGEDGETRFVHIIGDANGGVISHHQYGRHALELHDGRLIVLGSFLGGIEVDGVAVDSMGRHDAILGVIRPE